ncbi:MAG TPA: PRC-barrel domain-containing protein [Candidatus Norongarragalinales archaeon]|nr:PRC-barrel domain-containing protein [Candidatus Norongarragalinales archaeon]
MTVKLSQLIGMDIYTDNAQFVGKVYDVILDLQKGEVVRLTLEPIKVASKEEAKRVFREKTVMYRSVKAVEKIIIVSSTGAAPTADDLEEDKPATPEKPMPYSYRYRK